MQIAQTMLAALRDAAQEAPSIENMRLPFLQAWFADESISKYILLYHMLVDSESKAVMLKLLRNSIGSLLAGNIPKFHNYDQSQWREFEKQAAGLSPLAPSYTLDLIETWILDGYAYKDKCKAMPGEIVLDCGAYTGNTAFYFADQVGERGHVYSFEPMQQSFDLLQTNIAASGYKNISCFRYAVADTCGEACFSETKAAGSRKIESGGIKVPQTSIDAFVKDNGLQRVDFIKMDIEGSEKSALEGARETIKRHKPKLAICIYHRVDDFITLPATILEIEPTYRFFLKHNSYNFWETVLFATPHALAETLIDEAEITEVKAVWEAIEAVQASRSELARECLARQYAERIESRFPFFGAGIFHPGFIYVYWPLSDDSTLHYEYLFVGKVCEISLHFEGKYKKLTDVMEEICQASCIPIRNNPGRWKGCAIITQDINNVEKMASYMDYLIEISMPILYKHKLLSERLVLDERARRLYRPNQAIHNGI